MEILQKTGSGTILCWMPSAKTIKEALGLIKELIEKVKFKPVIDRKYPLEKIAEAYTYVASGQKNRQCHHYNGCLIICRKNLVLPSA